MTNANWKLVIEFFSGKAAEQVKWACDAINRALKEHGWGKGVSRPAHAAFNKVSGATKNLAREIDALREALPYCSDKYPNLNEAGAVPGLKDAWFSVYMAFSYGSSFKQESLDLIRQHAAVEQRHLVEAAERFFVGFSPIWAAMSYLDTLRPAPKFVMGKTLSATVATTITESGLNPTTLRLPEFRHEERQVAGKNGKMQTVTVTIIIWPKGTVHNQTRFGAKRGSAAGNLQCHACGHAIKNAFNWVPVVFDNASGVPHSMWVGRDCAKNLFNIDMTGDAEYVNTEGR